MSDGQATKASPPKRSVTHLLRTWPLHVGTVMAAMGFDWQFGLGAAIGIVGVLMAVGAAIDAAAEKIRGRP